MSWSDSAESDRVLIIGAAFTTVKQESALAIIPQKPEIHGPPQYFTPDWQGAYEAVLRLAALHPSVVLPAHGQPIRGAALRHQLRELMTHFAQVAKPERGRYAA